MPARLVYSPKVYVFTQQQSGAILDVSKFVVSGQIDRKINQVSSASITLRNPQRRFTQPSTGNVAFHPMDPITIYLERMAGKPVRVFTGYLDTAPYYTLYPKTITLQASCTLKRLLYTYFDPSLPYTNAFFRKWGWYNQGDGTMLALNDIPTKLNQTGNKAQDTSLGQLLWAILYDIGQWQDSNIYIENLPTDIVQKVVNLASNLKQSEDEAVKEFKLFLSNIIGDAAKGSGGGPGAATQNASNNTTVAPASGGQVPATPTGGYTRNSWAIAFLQALGAPVNDANVVGMMNWTSAEDGTWNNGGKYNPLNTTQNMPGHVVGYWNNLPGGGHVMEYDNWETGLKAIVQTIRNGYYPNLLKHLMDGKGNLLSDETSELSTWGTGSSWHAADPQPHTLKVSRVGVTTTPSKPSGSATATPAGQRGTKPLQHTPQQGARATQVGFGFGASNIFGDAISAAANATVNQAQDVQSSRIDCMVKAANNIDNAKYAYLMGGGHASAGTPSGNPPSFDCSGSVAAVLAAGNIIKPGTSVGADNSLVKQLLDAGVIQAGVGKGTPEVTLWDNPGVHIYMSLNGKYFGTWSGGSFTPTNGSGVGWSSGAATSGFTPYYIPMKTLNEKTTYAGPNGSGTASTPSTASDTSGASGSTSQADQAAANSYANAFVAQMEAPSLEDMVTAVALGGMHMGLMHDQVLLPFVQQVAQASMRSFQSLPNGDFYAFYPDYFGEFGQHNPYWLIDDLEILDGEINLSDDALATHVYAVGDTTWPISAEDGATGTFLNMLQAGTIDIFSAFGDNAKTLANTNNTDPVIDAEMAVEFIKRYGPRPLVQQYPMVRSQYFEMFLAYQQFMLAWSNQFKTPFTFTFMPELFPGGKVAFPDHGLQMYISSVSHSFDYSEGGFTTTAELSAPSQYGNNTTDLPPNMVKMSEAIFEPIRQAKTKDTHTDLTAANKQVQQQVVSALTEGVSEIEKALQNISLG